MRGFIPPQNSQESVFCKKAYSACERADKYGAKVFTEFLDLRQKDLFLSQCNKFSGLKTEFYSGFEGDSERCMACVFPEYDTIYGDEYPISVLVSAILPEDKLNHRDFLGALMNLMIKREYIGDILMFSDKCYIVCHANMAPIIISELKKVKHSSVSFERTVGSVQYTRDISLEKTVTVASLRLDGVLSAVLNISRSSSSAMIKKGDVMVNHLLVSRSDFEIEDSDILSIRGYGKYKLVYQGGKSRKDRFFITYLKY